MTTSKPIQIHMGLFDFFKKDSNETTSQIQNAFAHQIAVKNLQTLNDKIVRRIEEQYKTIVNDVKVFTQGQPEFQHFARGVLNANQFSFLTIIFLPVDIEEKVVIPKTYYYDTEKFRSLTAQSEWMTGYERKSYYQTLPSFEQIAKFIENIVDGADVEYNFTSKNPFNNSINRIIPDAELIDDLQYVAFTYFSNL